MKLSETSGYAAAETAKATYESEKSAKGARHADTAAAREAFCAARNACYAEMGVDAMIGKCP
jgi:hypothetical protein